MSGRTGTTQGAWTCCVLPEGSAEQDVRAPQPRVSGRLRGGCAESLRHVVSSSLTDAEEKELEYGMG